MTLVTGGTGFLGSRVTHALVAAGLEVVVLVRSSSSLRRLEDIRDRLVIENIDVVEVLEIFRRHPIRTVVHFATDYGRDGARASSVLKSNLIFPLEILEAAAATKTKVFINTDSYFNKGNLTYNALPNYSLSKKYFLTWLRTYSDSLYVINMRLEHIYGEDDSEDKFVIQTLKLLRDGRRVDLTFGHQRRDFVYVADVADAYLKIILCENRLESSGYREFEVGTGHSIFIRDFVECMKERLGSSSDLNYGAIDYRPDEIMDSKAATAELTEFLSRLGQAWTATFEYQRGIDQMLWFYRRPRSE